MFIKRMILKLRWQVFVGLFLIAGVAFGASTLSASFDVEKTTATEKKTVTQTQTEMTRTAVAGNSESPGSSKKNDSSADETAASGFPKTPMEIAGAMGKGFVVAFMIASIIAVWFSIERLVVLRPGRVIPRPFVERLLAHLRQKELSADEALKICQENNSPVAHIFAHGIRKWGKPSVEVEQAIIDGGERQVSQLRQHLRVLNGVATVTPLIGLFGTVLGMIQAFVDIEASAAVIGADAEKLQLATGIALALLTTATGLAIAIPSLILYMFLAGRVDSLVMAMDDLAQNIVHCISAEGLAVQKKKPAAAKKTS